MKSLIIIVVSFLFFVPSAYPDNHWGRDTIDTNRSKPSNPSFFGLRLYPEKLDSTSLERVVKEKDIYTCLLEETQKKRVFVLAYLKLDKLSIGEPYVGIDGAEIRSKFLQRSIDVTFLEDSIDCEESGDCDCGPFEFRVIMGMDTLTYARPRPKGVYKFDNAVINDTRFYYDDMSVGKSISKCKISQYIPKDIMANVHFIDIMTPRHCFWHIGGRNEVKGADAMYVHVYLDNGIIKRITIQAAL